MGQLRMFDEGSEVEPEQLSLDRARQMAYFLSQPARIHLPEWRSAGSLLKMGRSVGK